MVERELEPVAPDDDFPSGVTGQQRKPTVPVRLVVMST